MATTLKMLIEKAKNYYAAMEANRPALPDMGMVVVPTSKIYVFDQLLEQYNSEPKYEFKAKKLGQTPDQVVAEIIDLDLTQGITTGDAEVAKVSISNSPSIPCIEIILKILDHCAQAANGDLSTAQAKKNITKLAPTYKSRMGTLDTEAELLSDANTFLDEIAQNLQAAKAQELKDKQELAAYGEAIYRLKHQYNQKSDLLETRVKELNARCDALLFRHIENDKNYQQQTTELKDLLSRYEGLQTNLMNTTSALNKSTTLNLKTEEQLQGSIETISQRDATIAGLEARIEALQLPVDGQKSTQNKNTVPTQELHGNNSHLLWGRKKKTIQQIQPLSAELAETSRSGPGYGNGNNASGS